MSFCRERVSRCSLFLQPPFLILMDDDRPNGNNEGRVVIQLATSAQQHTKWSHCYVQNQLRRLDPPPLVVALLRCNSTESSSAPQDSDLRPDTNRVIPPKPGGSTATSPLDGIVRFLHVLLFLEDDFTDGSSNLTAGLLRSE